MKPLSEFIACCYKCQLLHLSSATAPTTHIYNCRLAGAIEICLSVITACDVGSEMQQKNSCLNPLPFAVQLPSGHFIVSLEYNSRHFHQVAPPGYTHLSLRGCLLLHIMMGHSLGGSCTGWGSRTVISSGRHIKTHEQCTVCISTTHPYIGSTSAARQHSRMLHS